MDALQWRLERHALAGAAVTSVADAVDRMVATRAWPSDAADLAVALRVLDPKRDALSQALESGSVVRSYAFRGGSFIFTPSIAADLLMTRTATRIWETKRWQEQGGFAISDWQPLREAMRGILGDGPLTRSQISERLDRIPGLRDLAQAALGAGADSLYKPLHWWGDICFGPTRGTEATFQLADPLQDEPADAAVDEAGRRSIRTYLHSYAPATVDNLAYWLAQGLGVPRRRLLAWIGDLGSEITTIDVDGVPSLALTEDVASIASARSPEILRLLPAFDPWFFGPGTADHRLIPTAQRALASNGYPLVISRGSAVATWRVRAQTVVVKPFVPSSQLPLQLLEDEIKHLARILNKDLDIVVEPQT
ncbi:winged helix DNA-binding domain-containing protein [Arthrobacter sp. AK01]|uniref:DNA glycosylase AlkZ-like family protein n=1 Tax=Arthrobacter sp. AK01 TaxID=2894084 RepID=UPI001E4C3B56|nr:crosslink repair DNA glycosylase YcaQ family protein [Arthrobacter sp. AK01]MCD4851099.1 winged helix DNA-binding domain-containing protein [Arthrobacter sp. AK01]